MICLNSFRTKNKLTSHVKLGKDKDFCGAVMPSEDDEILELSQYMKSDKMPYTFYDDIESLIRQMCK